VPLSLPDQWGRWETDGKREELCQLCVAALEEALQSGPYPAPAVEVTALQHQRGIRAVSERLPRPPRWAPSRPRHDASVAAAAQEAAGLPYRLTGLVRRVASSVPLPRAVDFRRHRLVVSGLCAVISLVAVVGVSAEGYSPVSLADLAPSASRTAHSERDSSPPLTASPAASAASFTQQPLAAEGSPATETPPAEETLAALPDQRVTAIGDSVMLAAAENLERDFEALEVDAAVGRQASEVIDILRARREAGSLGSVVLVHTGNNGPLAQAEIDTIMEILADVPEVLLMNVHVPQPWQDPNNGLLAQAPERYANAHLIDWAGASVNRPDLFWDDETHLTPSGAAMYASLVSEQLRAAGVEPAPGAEVASTPVASTRAASNPATAALAALTTPASRTSTPAPAVPAGGATLLLTAERDTQVRVTVDGVVAFSGVLPASETSSWEGNSTVAVWTNDADSLTVTVNGFELGPLPVAVGHPDWNTVDWTWSADWKPR